LSNKAAPGFIEIPPHVFFGKPARAGSFRKRFRPASTRRAAQCVSGWQTPQETVELALPRVICASDLGKPHSQPPRRAAPYTRFIAATLDLFYVQRAVAVTRHVSWKECAVEPLKLRVGLPPWTTAASWEARIGRPIWLLYRPRWKKDERRQYLHLRHPAPPQYDLPPLGYAGVRRW